MLSSDQPDEPCVGHHRLGLSSTLEALGSIDVVRNNPSMTCVIDGGGIHTTPHVYDKDVVLYLVY